MRIAWIAVLAAGMLPAAAQEPKPAAKKPADDFEARILPMLKKYCLPCHNPEKKKGEFDLSAFTTQQHAAAHVEAWKDMVERINAFEMPPKKSPEPSHDDKEFLNRWFSKLPKTKLDCNQLANDRNQRFYKGYVMSRRLNRSEYARSVRDLFGTDLDAGRDLPADGSGGEGFDNNGDALFSSPLLVEKYLEAADRVLAALLPDGGPSKSPALAAPAKTRDGARQVLSELARRAFRRPVESGEVDRMLALFDRARNRGDAFEASLRLAAKGVLVSPHFLFIVEPEPPKEGVYPLGSWQLAQRLSYFLWSSIPDEELHRLAAENKLQDPAVLKDQVRRMLKDPRSRSLGETFAVQWLELDPLGVTVRPDPKKFPEFDDALAASMKEEAVRLFHDILASDGSLLHLIDADYTHVDARLARLYGIPGVEGPGFRRVKLPDPNRGGVAGMAAVHAVNSYPLRTSPVLRGKWLLESFLGTKIPPPPPNVPSLPESKPGDAPVSLRARLEQHRSNPECASCHSKIDPLGFGLENFDPLGRWRTKDEDGLPLDTTGVLPNGQRFSTPQELKKLLLSRKDEIVSHLAKKMLGFALGRALNPFDRCVVDDAMKALKAENYRSGALVETIVLSYPFRHRYAKK